MVQWFSQSHVDTSQDRVSYGVVTKSPNLWFYKIKVSLSVVSWSDVAQMAPPDGFTGRVT